MPDINIDHEVSSNNDAYGDYPAGLTRLSKIL